MLQKLFGPKPVNVVFRKEVGGLTFRGSKQNIDKTFKSLNRQAGRFKTAEQALNHFNVGLEFWRRMLFLKGENSNRTAYVINDGDIGKFVQNNLGGKLKGYVLDSEEMTLDIKLYRQEKSHKYKIVFMITNENTSANKLLSAIIY